MSHFGFKHYKNILQRSQEVDQNCVTVFIHKKSLFRVNGSGNSLNFLFWFLFLILNNERGQEVHEN